MTVGILYIAIGKYIAFWEAFYDSCEAYFLPGVRKEYYVWSDQKPVVSPTVHWYDQEDMGWPGNTLFRFDLFMKREDDFASCDYLFFFNANTLFKREILAVEVIPSANENHLTALSWHLFAIKNKEEYPYDRNPESEAYIPYSQGNRYYQGGLNGGRSPEYRALMRSCSTAINKDDSKGIIALVNDESHLNHYLSDKKVKILSTSYGRPEEWLFPSSPKIIFRDKNRVLGDDYMVTLKKIKRRKRGHIKRFLSEGYKYFRFLCLNRKER